MSTQPSAIVRDWNAAPAVAVVGDAYHILVSGKETDGKYTMVGIDTRPGGGPPPHTHTREEEIFFILEGELTFYTEGKTVVGKPGTAVYLPRGREHYFRNHGTNPARALVQAIPAGLDAFFEEVGEPVVAGRPSGPPSESHIKKIIEAAPRYGIVISPPRE